MSSYWKCFPNLMHKKYFHKNSRDFWVIFLQFYVLSIHKIQLFPLRYYKFWPKRSVNFKKYFPKNEWNNSTLGIIVLLGRIIPFIFWKNLRILKIFRKLLTFSFYMFVTLKREMVFKKCSKTDILNKKIGFQSFRGFLTFKVRV